MGATIRGEAEKQEELERLKMGQPAPRTHKFEQGQSVHQWWAKWMMKAKAGGLPATYAQKNRPAWYKAEVLARKPEPEDIEYCGILYKSVFLHRAV